MQTPTGDPKSSPMLLHHMALQVLVTYPGNTAVSSGLSTAGIGSGKSPPFGMLTGTKVDTGCADTTDAIDTTDTTKRYRPLYHAEPKMRFVPLLSPLVISQCQTADCLARYLLQRQGVVEALSVHGKSSHSQLSEASCQSSELQQAKEERVSPDDLSPQNPHLASFEWREAQILYANTFSTAEHLHGS